MDIQKEAEKPAKNVNKDDLKKAVSQALDSKEADKVIDKVNEKMKKDISKDDIKNAVDSFLK